MDSGGSPVGSGGENLSPGQHPFNYWIDFPGGLHYGSAGSIDYQANGTLDEVNIWPGYDNGDYGSGVRAYPSNVVYTNFYCNVPPSAGGVAGTSNFPGGNGVQGGHVYQLTVAVRENPADHNNLSDNPSVAPGPTFQAFLIDTDPNWATDGNPNNQEYTTVAAGALVTSTTAWADITSAAWTAPSTSAGDTLELYVRANGYYGLVSGGGWDATQSDVSNFRLSDVTPVPEPTTTALLAAGLGSSLFIARRRRRK
jgi:hypothetical protein